MLAPRLPLCQQKLYLHISQLSFFEVQPWAAFGVTMYEGLFLPHDLDPEALARSIEELLALYPEFAGRCDSLHCSLPPNPCTALYSRAPPFRVRAVRTHCHGTCCSMPCHSAWARMIICTSALIKGSCCVALHRFAAASSQDAAAVPEGMCRTHYLTCCNAGVPLHEARWTGKAATDFSFADTLRGTENHDPANAEALPCWFQVGVVRSSKV